LPELPLTWLDVFTDVPLAGNGVAVVHDAEGLDDATMQHFALETRLSETTFVSSPSSPDADYRVRFWTMAGEIRFAGHPSLGTAVAVARLRGVSGGSFVQQTDAGLQPIDVEIDGLVARTSMLQEPAEFGPELDAARVLAALSLPPSYAVDGLPAQVVSTGAPQILVPVVPEALAEVVPRPGDVGALLSEYGCVVVYLAVCDPASGTVRARSFMQDPSGAAEDPATGSAVGPLCAYLEQRAGCTKIVTDQGVEMGRPSRLHAQMQGDRVRVSGDVVVVAEGSVWL
jgi:trans-2,3-dihydro-3-hydroxyanthranilate isomerase